GFLRQRRAADPVEHGGLETGEAEVEGIALHPNAPEWDGLRVTEARQAVDDGPSRVAQRQEFRDLVESLARRVVASLAELSVRESRGSTGSLACLRASRAPRLHAKQAGVPARDYQGHAGKKGLLDLSRRRASGDFGFKKHGVDVTLEMVDADQRLPER